MSDVTFGVKVPEELKKQIDDLMKDSGLRTGKDFMQQLINCYVVEKTKENIPEVAEDLKELQVLTQRINNIYLNLGYRIDNVTKAQQEQQEQQISKKDSIISDLQNKIDIAINDKNTITEAYNNIVNQNNDYLQRVNELTDSNNNIKALNEEFNGKYDMLLGDLKEHKQYKVQVEELKALLASQQADNVEKDNSIKELNINLTGLNKDIEKLKQEHEKVVNELNIKHTTEIENINSKNNNDKATELLKLKTTVVEKIESINVKHNTEIENWQSKYNLLLERLEKEKTITKAKEVTPATTTNIKSK